MSRKKPLPLYENVEVLNAAAEGKSICRIGEFVVFVGNAVPGDVIDLQVRFKKKNYAEGDAVRFHRYSDKRIAPVCQHFGICGGCKWQMLDYPWQLHYKHEQVRDTLKRLGKIELPELFPILGSKEVYFYRNRLDYSFTNRKWLTVQEVESGVDFGTRNGFGFHVPGTFDRVLDVQFCHLQGEPSNALRNFVREKAMELGLSFNDIRNDHGLLRSMTVRTASTGETMVVFVFRSGDEEGRNLLLDAVREKFADITSLMYVINDKKNETWNDLEVILHSGAPHIFEAMEDLRFKVGPKSFYQTNSKQAYELYKVAREFAGLTGDELVYDLYTGTGTIAQFVARKARKVIGVEYVAPAIEDARENAELNGITNTSFFAADMKDIFTPAFLEEHGKPDVIITDPPRAGMHEDVVRCLAGSGAKRIVYVSCNPASQARDLQLLDSVYRVVKVQPVDMFPHTHHVENVVLLEKR